MGPSGWLLSGFSGIEVVRSCMSRQIKRSCHKYCELGGAYQSKPPMLAATANFCPDLFYLGSLAIMLYGVLLFKVH